jgi:uncharacterized protein (TIGR03083 family)
MAIEYTDHLRADGERMAVAVARDLDAHVPTCPAWNVAKLTIHTGQHHRWVADAVSKGGPPPDDIPKPGLRGDELIEWFRQGWRDLADLLDGSEDQSPAWSWSGDNRVGFWRRRTTLETLVHRYDAENATGEVSPLDPELSSDGVDEMFYVHMDHPENTYPGSPARVHFATTDADGAWTLKFEKGEVPAPSKGLKGDADVTFEAPAAERLLYIWGRLGRDAVTIKGGEALVSEIGTWIEE